MYERRIFVYLLPLARRISNHSYLLVISYPHDKTPKLNLEIPISTTKSKHKLYTFKNVKSLRFEIKYPNGDGNKILALREIMKHKILQDQF